MTKCLRYEKATLKQAVDDALEKTSRPPDVMLVVVACDVSLEACKKYEEYARAKGIETPMLWPASMLEAKLYSDHPVLLFAFFDVSLARQERGREAMLKRNLVMKRKLTRIFTPKHKDQG